MAARAEGQTDNQLCVIGGALRVKATCREYPPRAEVRGLRALCGTARSTALQLQPAGLRVRGLKGIVQTFYLSSVQSNSLVMTDLTS